MTQTKMSDPAMRTLPPLEEKCFWDLIASSICPRQEEQLCTLIVELSKLDPDEILAFDIRLWDYLGRANLINLWAAAYLMRGGCSDDSFLYFRCWLISRGYAVFAKALTNPDSLASRTISATDCDFELILAAPASAWENQTGTGRDAFDQAMGQIERQVYPPLQGDSFNFEDHTELQRRLPRLYRKYSHR
jgi:hypothetical protein